MKQKKCVDEVVQGLIPGVLKFAAKQLSNCEDVEIFV